MTYSEFFSKAIKVLPQGFFAYLKRRFQSVPRTHLVSIVVPAFNEEEFLEKCLQSIQRQSYKNFECLIVSDHSTDKTPEIAQKFAEADPRFRLIRHSSNQGLSASRNTGLFQAKGELITFVDADDILLPHALTDRIRQIDYSDEACVGAYGAILSVAEKIPKGTKLLAEFRFPRTPYIDFLTNEGECPFGVHAALVRTKVAKELGGFNPNLRTGAEDWDFWIRVLREGFYFNGCYSFVGLYRQRPNSMIRRLTSAHAAAARQILESVHQNYSPKNALAGRAFREPLWIYQLELHKIRRFISFAALSYFAGQERNSEEILQSICPEKFQALKHRINAHALIKDAFVRHSNCPGLLPSLSLTKQDAQLILKCRKEILEKLNRPLPAPSHKSAWHLR